MNTNEWHQWHTPGSSPTGRPHPQQPYGAPRPYASAPDHTLNEKYITVERKVFKVALKENTRGRFLRISEYSETRRNVVIFPDTGLEDLLTVLVEMVETNKKIPHQNPPAAPSAE